MLSTLLATKLHKPRPTANLVVRPRLTQRLDEGLQNGHRLFLVVAPAGYGKTTLVADWLDTTSMPFAWVSLDEVDNDTLSFYTYIEAALQKTLGSKLAQLLPETFPMTPKSPEAFALPLINDLATIDQMILLVLDDYHVISARPVHEAMELLLRSAPPNLHLVVLTRADPPFPLSRLRVREQMTEIRDRDLRFTPEEMTAFLNAMHHLDLLAEQISALESRTEGWAAGVQLAALSLQGSSAEHAAQFISAFSGSHHYIVDYLFDEVLSRQPESVRDFLLRTSILERMCTPLCDAILSGGESGIDGCGDGDSTSPSYEILDYLGRSNLFLVPLDDERCWYRYHHLFIDVLRQMHKSVLQPEQITGLHSRASDWYKQNGFVADAIHHTMQAGDHERAAEIVEENARSMMLHAELATLEKWVQALPEDTLSKRPWLRIYYAFSLFFSASDKAEAQLQAVEQHLRESGSIEPPEMQGHIAAVRAWIAYLRGDLDRAYLFVHQALEFCPQMDAAIRSGVMAILGVCYRVNNDIDGAMRAYAEALELALASGNVMLEVIARTALGSLNQVMGHLHEAEAIFHEALQTAIRYKSPVAGQAYACLAILNLEWNELETSRRYVEKLIESSAMWGAADALAVGYLDLALIHQAQDDFAGANQAMAKASQVMRQHPLELPSMPWLGATRARLWLEQGRLDQARQWAETRGLSIDGKLDLRNMFEYLTFVRVLLAEHKLDDGAHLLSRLQNTLESTGQQGSLVPVLVLVAVVLDMLADTVSALAALEQAVRLAHSEGFVRTFLDEGPSIEKLLKMATKQWRDPELLTYALKLLAAFAGEGGQPTAGQVTQPSLLSERELEVLQLLAAGASNNDIAEDLVITVGTTKRHIANIFVKLDVRNRTEAVAKARQLGLM